MNSIPKGLRKCHHPAVSSVVLREGPYMVRAFLADAASGARTVAPHSHRTSLRLTVLRGGVNHHRFTETWGKGIPTQRHTFRSVLLGGEGLSKDFVPFPAADRTEQFWQCGSLVLPHDQIHTVEWTEDAVWLVQEGPVVTDTTTVLIRPGLDEMGTDGLYEPMDEAEYRERCDLVWRLAASLGVMP